MAGPPASLPLGCRVRPATSADAGAVAVIYAHHVTHGTASFDLVPRSIAATEGKIAACREAGLPFLVVEDGSGAVVAYAYATPFRDRPAYGLSCEDSIYVAPDRVGQGIGGALLAALIDAATEAGFRQMIAVIGGAEPASAALHARAGFVEAGRMRAVGRKGGRWLDSLYMQRALGAGAATPPEREP